MAREEAAMRLACVLVIVFMLSGPAVAGTIVPSVYDDWRARGTSGAPEREYDFPPELLGYYRSLARVRPFHLDQVATPDFPNAFVALGSETALAYDATNPQAIIGVFNEEFGFPYPNPDRPLSYSLNGGQANSWGPSNPPSFPMASAPFHGMPFDPWVQPGTGGGLYVVSLIRPDTILADKFQFSRTVLAFSSNDGVDVTKLYEADPTADQDIDFFQDREMFDLDRTTAQGGGAGALNDGLIVLCYDDQFNAAAPAFHGCYLEVVAGVPGVRVAKVKISDPVAFCRGLHFQPVAATADGKFFLKSSLSIAGDKQRALFHRVQLIQSLSPPTGAAPFRVADPPVVTVDGAYSLDSLEWARVGQQLQNSQRWGLNGMRIDQDGFLAIDRSQGVRRGRLYFLAASNPNPADTTKDQGDLFLKYSNGDGKNWTSVQAPIPAVAGKTQYQPMLDVDAQGWIHVGYYQNEDRPFNASTANLYYTVSLNGGASWRAPVRVNDFTVLFQYPAPDLSSKDFYFIGDYAQVRATGTGASTLAGVLWTGIDAEPPFPRKVYFAQASVANLVAVGDEPRWRALALAIDGNPSSGSTVRVRYALAGDGPARIELVDVAGRRVMARDLEDRASGEHAVALRPARALDPGVYFLRLTQGDASRATRFAVLK